MSQLPRDKGNRELQEGDFVHCPYVTFDRVKILACPGDSIVMINDADNVIVTIKSELSDQLRLLERPPAPETEVEPVPQISEDDQRLRPHINLDPAPTEPTAPGDTSPPGEPNEPTVTPAGQADGPGHEGSPDL